MGYRIEITGNGSASELVEALQRVIEELEEEPTENVSYSSVNDDMDIDVEINPDGEEEEEED